MSSLSAVIHPRCQKCQPPAVLLKARLPQAKQGDSQRRWLQKPENRDYFRGPEHVLRVQRWRAAHPGYWRRAKASRVALQDPLIAQLSVNAPNFHHAPKDALQDLLILQPAVMVGLIAQLTGSALQDDIARAARRMQQLGNDILYPPA